MILIINKTVDRYFRPSVQAVLFSTIETPALWTRARKWAEANGDGSFAIAVPSQPDPTDPGSVFWDRGTCCARMIGRAVFGLEIPS